MASIANQSGNNKHLISPVYTPSLLKTIFQHGEEQQQDEHMRQFNFTTEVLIVKDHQLH